MVPPVKQDTIPPRTRGQKEAAGADMTRVSYQSPGAQGAITDRPSRPSATSKKTTKKTKKIPDNMFDLMDMSEDSA